MRPSCGRAIVEYTYKGIVRANSAGRGVSVRVYSTYRPFCANGRGLISANKHISGFEGHFNVRRGWTIPVLHKFGDRGLLR